MDNIIAVSRFFWGPFSPEICTWFFVARKSINTIIFLLVDAITFLRYLFIFWLKNPAAFHDEFWTIFITLWSFSFSYILHLVRVFVPGNHLLELAVCSGEDPESFIHLPPVFAGYIEILSIILHLLVYARIVIYKFFGNQRSNESKFLRISMRQNIDTV